MKPLLSLGPAELSAGAGMYPGPNKAAVPLWQEGFNIGFGEWGFKRVDAADAIRSAGFTVREIKQFYKPGENFPQQRVYVATDENVKKFAYENGAWLADQQIIVWPTITDWQDIETWGSWVVGTNGADTPRIWKDTAFAGSAWSNLPFQTARIFKKKQNMMMAFNTDNIGDVGVEWADPRSIEADISVGVPAWTPVAENRAGNFFIRDLDSGILSVQDLGDALAIYSHSSLVVGNFVGGNTVWGFKKRGEVGAISKRSVIPLGPYNYGLTTFGVWKTDGNSSVWLPDDPVISWLKRTLDITKAHRVWGFYDEIFRCLTWYFQDAFNIWHSVSYVPDSGVWTKGNFQATAGAKKEVFSHPLLALTEDVGDVALWQGEVSDVGFSLKSKPFDFGDRQRLKYLQFIRVDGVWDASNKLKITALDHPEAAGTVVWDKALGRENYPEREARYFTFEFYGNKPLKITGLEFYGQPAGVSF